MWLCACEENRKTTVGLHYSNLAVEPLCLRVARTEALPPRKTLESTNGVWRRWRNKPERRRANENDAILARLFRFSPISNDGNLGKNHYFGYSLLFNTDISHFWVYKYFLAENEQGTNHSLQSLGTKWFRFGVGREEESFCTLAILAGILMKPNFWSITRSFGYGSVG